MRKLKLTSQVKKVDNQGEEGGNIGLVIVDQETSGKTFWKRFIKENKEFEKKIFLNENVEDFRMYFEGKL